MANSLRGFILQPTYRIEGGKPVIHLWGRLESGETFLVRDDRSTPHFYIRQADRMRAQTLGVERMVPSTRRSMAGEPVVRIEVPVPPETVAIRDRLHRSGIDTFEADVRFATRYLIDRDIRGTLAIEGASVSGRRVGRIYENPCLEPADWSPRLDVLSLDIETDARAKRILSVGLFGCGAAEVILVSPGGRAARVGALVVSSESELLHELQRRVAMLDPDVLTGWNVVDFDCAVLARRAGELGIALELGRGRGVLRFRSGRSRHESSQVTTPGRLVLDGLQLLRGAFVRMERHSLDFVAMEVLGEGKKLGGTPGVEGILSAYRSDPARFVEYNLTDARLVIEILEKLQLVELAVERSRLTGLPLDRVSSSVAAFDFLYLKELGKREIVAPSVRSGRPEAVSMGGGQVLEPAPGVYDNVLIFDFKSLYPSIIQTFQIDPLGYVTKGVSDTSMIVAPNGAAFSRRRGILTQLLDELLPRREQAKQSGRQVESTAIKILMNSFYGVLGTPVCRFFNPEVANAITSFGRELLLWSRDQLETWGHRVLYGDTDSLFVESDIAWDSTRVEALGSTLVERLNDALREHVRRTWEVESRLEVEFEKVYRRLFLPPVRSGSSGARKRYAGLIERDGVPSVELVGLEAVRRDWTDLARQAQRELFRRLFLELPVVEYLAGLVRDLRAGVLDELLVYRKALRKDLDAYTSTTPPHVVAARKLSGPPDRLVAYCMTVNGPEPLENICSAMDYQHYLDKQLRPVADPILTHLGLDFAKVIGDDRQLELF
jgi:DNA polymerase-2